MMTFISLVLFGAAFAATLCVFFLTLAPAMPRIIAILAQGTGDTASLPSFAAPRERSRAVIRSRASLGGVAFRAAA